MILIQQPILNLLLNTINRKMVTMSKEYAQEYYKKNKEYFKEKQTAKR